MPVLRLATARLGVEHTPTGKALGLTDARSMALATVGAGEGCSTADQAARLSLPDVIQAPEDTLWEAGRPMVGRKGRW